MSNEEPKRRPISSHLISLTFRFCACDSTLPRRRVTRRQIDLPALPLMDDGACHLSPAQQSKQTAAQQPCMDPKATPGPNKRNVLPHFHPPRNTTIRILRSYRSTRTSSTRPTCFIILFLHSLLPSPPLTMEKRDGDRDRVPVKHNSLAGQGYWALEGDFGVDPIRARNLPKSARTHGSGSGAFGGGRGAVVGWFPQPDVSSWVHAWLNRFFLLSCCPVPAFFLGMG